MIDMLMIPFTVLLFPGDAKSSLCPWQMQVSLQTSAIRTFSLSFFFFFFFCPQQIICSLWAFSSRDENLDFSRFSSQDFHTFHVSLQRRKWGDRETDWLICSETLHTSHHINAEIRHQTNCCLAEMLLPPTRKGVYCYRFSRAEKN